MAATKLCQVSNNKNTNAAEDTTKNNFSENRVNVTLKENKLVERIVNNMTIDKMSDDNRCTDCSTENNLNKNKMENLTEIQKFYYGKNVLITGATGFLGKVLVEKLLRCCPGVENLYLLVRQKRGKDIYTRVDEIFDDPVFNRLKEEVPKFRHKIVVIPGDCEAAGLGLTLSDRQMIMEKVNIIFHSAATVKFDEHLRAALATNVGASLHLLRLAGNMKGLDVLMHVSTAYSNSHLPEIEEKFYPCDAECDKLRDMIEKLSDREIEKLLPTILGPWPNTYTFTKALAEKELRVNAGNIPLAIFRPAIVTSTAKEPLRSWLDNMYGPTGIAVGSATGILRTIQCDGVTTADLVPVDYVVNCIMAAAASVHRAYRSNPPPEPPIYNYVSSVENRITWNEFQTQNMARVDKYPFSNAVWYVSLRINRSETMNRIYIILLHLLPAALVDGLALCVGKKPKMLKVYRKIHRFSSVLAYFCTRNIKFCNRQTRELWDNTSEEDKELFPFSMAEINWSEYFEEYLLGIRRYLFKESDDTLPAARIKWKRLYYLHQIVKLVFFCLVIYFLWSVFSNMW